MSAARLTADAIGAALRQTHDRPNVIVTYVPLGIIVLTLIALVVVPFIGESYERTFQQELRRTAEPARGLITNVHLALALGGDAVHDFVATGDTSSLTRYHQTAFREEESYEQLSALSERLGPSVHRRFITLQEASARWHEAVDALLARADVTIPRRRLAPSGGAYEEVLVAAAQLDDAITRAGHVHRQRLLEAERTQMQVTWLLLVMGMLALVMAAWVGRRLRVIAAEAGSRRQEIERLMEGKARLFRGLSHDLRNPLNVIYSHAQLLEDGVIGEPSPAQQKSLAHIRRSVRAILGLLEDLLELWRAETGELKAASEHTDLEEIVRDVAEAYRAVAEAAGHRLRLDVPADLPSLHTDARRVRQVLGNLLSNAIKYTPPGGLITMRLRVRSSLVRAQRGRWVAIEVSDTGPGVPPDKVEAIFEEFTRLTPSVPGVGLGLAISRRIARMLGGDIAVEAGTYEGATFVLSLPIVVPTHDRRTRPVGPAATPEQAILRESMAR